MKSAKTDSERKKTTQNKSLDSVYAGSVKQVFASKSDPDSLWFEFSDDYSVFDWGKMPDQIVNKGKALTLIGAFFFEKLASAQYWSALPKSKHLKKFSSEFLNRRFEHIVYCGPAGLSEKGLPTHFQNLTDESGAPLSIMKAAGCRERLLMQVERAHIRRPNVINILGQPIFFYPQPNPQAKSRLIPLEVVFRFGMPAGSSLEQRLNAIGDYEKTLGFQKKPQPNEFFDFPILEFFTKLEPKDRFLSMQEAATLSGLSGLSGSDFTNLTETALDIALALYDLFATAGIELWDGKIEFLFRSADDFANQNEPIKSDIEITSSQGEAHDSSVIVLADSIGPDELRLLYKGQQLSKEMLRQFYRGSQWDKALKEAQDIASKRGSIAWKEICLEELKAKPNPLSVPFKKAVDHLYGVLANALIAQAPFEDQPTLDEFVEQVSALNKDRSACQ
jgi:phosphoribosylaminoimidazole-succinocarboxamide synthase